MIESLGILFLTFLTMTISWFFSRRRPLGPPGPLGLPLLGSLHSLDATSPHKSLAGIAKKYGSKGACELFLGSLRTVLLTDPKLIREAFAKDVFSGRAPLYLTHGIMEGYGLICAEGDMWKDHRHLLSSWLRSLGATKVSPRRQHFERRISKSLDALDKKLSARPDPNVAMDSDTVFADFVGNLVNEVVFGVSFRENDETWKWLMHIQEEGTRAMGVAAIVNFMPYLRFFMKSIRKTIKCIVSGQAQTHSIYRSIIETRRRIRKVALEENKMDQDAENPGEKIKCVHYGIINDNSTKFHYFSPKDLIISKDDCILDYYLDEQEKRQHNNPRDESSLRLSDKQLIFFLADLFGAGLDTTHCTMLWFCLYMAIFTKFQEQAREEILSVCGDRCPSLDDLPQLPYMRATICETQRLRPVVPVGIPHGCLQDAILGEYLIKKGTMVVPLQWSLHSDGEAWEDPDVFNPSRFLGPDGDVINSPYFIPFQMGKRMCPGDEFARNLLFMFGSRIVSKYTLELEGAAPSLDGIMGLTLSPPPYRLKIIPIKRDVLIKND